MTRTIHYLASATLLLGSAATALAGPAEIESAAGKALIAPAPAANPLSFFDGRLVFDAQERVRWEIRENNYDFNSQVKSLTDDDWFLQRFRIGITIKPVSWLTIYAQGQDSREIGSGRPHTPGLNAAEGDDSFDLRQGYLEISDFDKCPWGLRVGRQILSYGDERLIGAFDWNNFGRTFDAAKLMYHGQGWALDAFSSTPAVISRSQYNQSDLFNGNETHRDLIFSGLYFSANALPFGSLDLYSLLLDQKNGNDTNVEGLLGLRPGAKGSLLDRSDFVTLGTRIKGDPAKLHGFEFQGEFAYQVGKVRDLNLSAFAVNAGVGYNFDVPWKPRLAVEYNYASGDDDPNDRDLGTFQNLFPTNHKFYGILDAFSWQNMQNPMISARISPCKSVTAQVDYNAFWLANTNDVWYRANGLTAVRPLSPAARQASNYAGSELDFILTWNAHKYVQIQGGYSHFFAGTYLKDTGAHSDADFGYIQATFNF